MAPIRLCDPVLIVGLNKLGFAMHQALGDIGYRDIAIWAPNHRPADNKSIVKLFGRSLSKVFWGHDTPDRVFVVTIVALDVHPGTVWPLRFGTIMTVPEVFARGLSGKVAALSPHLNEVRRILAGFESVGKDLGFDDPPEMITLHGLSIEEPGDDIEKERIDPEEPRRPVIDALFPNGRKPRKEAARA
jgi:hypothetical protein